MMDDAGSSSSTSRMAAVKLIPKKLPKKLASKRTWKKRPSNASSESFAGSLTSNEEHARGRSTDARDLSGPGSLSTMQSGESPDEDDEAGYDTARDSDHESGFDGSSSRPAVPSTHPSQIGHLTTSSPIIQSDHLPEVQLDQQETLESLSRSATLSVASSDQSHEPPQPLSTSKTSLHLPSDSSRRSKSPAGRLKNAFRGMRNSGATSSNGSQNDRQSQTARVDSDPRPGSAASSQPDTRGSDQASNEPSQKKSQPPAGLSVRPHTPPTSDSPRPVIVNTPPTPTELYHANTKSSTFSNPNVVVSPSGNMISHRRARSGSAASLGPSKLSNIVSAPLTPTPENAVPPTPGTGFFSSVLSAAQNAANTLSNTITNTNISSGGSKPKVNTTPKGAYPTNDDTVEVESPAEEVKSSNMEGKEPAVKTLGMGDLSLSQLGFQETMSTAPTPTGSKSGGSAVESRARSESAPADSETVPANGDGTSDNPGVDRPRSPYEHPNTSPSSSIYEGGSGVHRTSSIRSAISKRRKRGSTVGTNGTGNTIGAAIVAAHASVAHPSAAGSTGKLTGFAVASKKRNRDFHALFKSVPDDDYLIEDYSCALQREILAHGRLYVSEGHLCFSSNILGWVTTLVMSFDEIVSVEKRSTALVFKNGLMISTLHAKHVFASFTSRDSTYDLIVNIWKLGHPTLRSSLNGVSIDETGGDKTEIGDERAGAAESRSASGSEDDDSDDDDIYDEDMEEDDIHEETQQTESNQADTDADKAVPRKVSGAAALNGGAVDKSDATPSSGGADFPGPATHAPTDCGDADSHFEVVVGDDIVAAPLGKVYSYMFGPASVAWMSKWLTNDQKCADLQMEDKKGLSQDNKSRAYSYIKPLYASLGPKQTKCIVTETIENIDFDKAVNVLVTTQTPDVPNGNLFSVKTKYCLFWAENNSTRVTMNCTIEWTGKSWLKGAIEKGAKDGQTQYWKDLLNSLKGAVSSRPRNTTLNGASKGGKKKKTKGKLDRASKDPLRSPADSTSAKSQDWGLFEPLHSILGPIFDILKPVMTGNVVYGLLVGLLVSTWFGFGFNGQRRGAGYGRDIAFSSYPERAIAYEEIWRREESDLWDWLEERVGLHRVSEGGVPVRKRAVEPRTMEEKLSEERMSELEVEEAIRTTEEKLNILKSVMDRKKDTMPNARNGGSSSKSSTTTDPTVES